MLDTLDARAKAVIDQVIDLEGPERNNLLRRGCAGDPELRSRVESLLASMEKDDRFLSKPVVKYVRTLRDQAESEMPGSRIGPYTLVELIGEGGFGSVYLAEQSKPVRRQVALKIIKLGMDTRQMIARFEAERQALALMDHPNIARVLEAGATENGRPYFVMELVRGEPITKYCDRERQSIQERLELFRDICGAVQHAHQKGVIHRDIKPSNVLITVVDGRAIPKVIDFGIAKACPPNGGVTAGRLTDMSLHTELHQLIGTPDYMSPEQAESSSADIDTRSDVYSLGVLLFELLTGNTPFDRRLHSAPLVEIQRIIREEMPPRPSLRVATAAASSGHYRLQTPATDPGSSPGSSVIEIAQCRRTEPLPLTRAIRGDLDWIVLKCLEKDRSRRYETASALADDIGHYLDHQPVLATPPSARYRLRKFMRRNRVPVLAGAVVAVALVLAVAGLTIGLMKAREGQREAKERADELEMVAEFQKTQLSGIDVQQMGNRIRDDLMADARESMEHRGLSGKEAAQRQVQLAELLADVNLTNIALKSLDANIFDRALEAVEVQFAKQPLIKSRLLQTVAETMLEISLPNRAMEPQLEALAIRRRLLSDAHIDTITSMIVTARLFAELGKLSDAEALGREAVGHARLSAPDDKVLGTALAHLGLILLLEGKLTEAEIQLREALKILQEVGEHDSGFLSALSNMGGVFMETGRPAEAEPYFRRALEIHRLSLGDDDQETIRAAANLGFSLEQQGKILESEPYYRETMEKRRRLLGDDHSTTILAINNMAWLADELGHHDGAMALYDEAIARARRTLGDQNPYTLRYIGNLGHSMRQHGRPIDAEALYREALAGFESQLGRNHVFTATNAAGVGGSLLDQGLLAEAEPQLLDAARAFDAAQGVARMEHERCIRDLTELYTALEDAQPDKAYDAKAAEWHAKLDALRAATQPAPP